MLKSGDLTGDTFNMPISVPYNDVPLLSNNTTFQDVDINAGTLASGQALNLDQIGTNPAHLQLRLRERLHGGVRRRSMSGPMSMP